LAYVGHSAVSSVEDPHHLDADPDTACHFDEDADPDSDHTFDFDAASDPAPDPSVK
jgi:hypothetical protein